MKLIIDIGNTNIKLAVFEKKYNKKNIFINQFKK